MSSEFGNALKISVFGESHGKCVGVVADGLPPGEKIDMEQLYAFMARRRPGSGPASTGRDEADVPIFASGVREGATCAAPLMAYIENTDVRSSDYKAFTDTPRPSHADFPAYLRYGGKADMRGGGHFSGRLTAPLCIAGGIAIQILERRGIFTGAHLIEAAGIRDEAYDGVLLTKEELLAPGNKSFPVICDEKGEEMLAAIALAKDEEDSVGGVVECAVIGFPPGVGDPMFDGIENRISRAVFGIPAVRGIEFGAGFAAARMRGSRHNDPFAVKRGVISTLTNSHGGILGGISTGMPVIFSTAIKPTPSIGMEQSTVSITKAENTRLVIRGRHDPCIAHRAVPVIEAVAACVLLDMLIERNMI